MIRCVKRADANEPDDWTRTRVVRPYRDSTGRAPGDFLATAATRWSIDDRRLNIQMNHAVRLDHGIQGKRSAALALAPPAVTTVYDQRPRLHAIADKAAIAAAIERKDRCAGQFRMLLTCAPTAIAYASHGDCKIAPQVATSDRLPETQMVNHEPCGSGDAK